MRVIGAPVAARMSLVRPPEIEYKAVTVQSTTPTTPTAAEVMRRAFLLVLRRESRTSFKESMSSIMGPSNPTTVLRAKKTICNIVISDPDNLLVMGKKSSIELGGYYMVILPVVRVRVQNGWHVECLCEYSTRVKDD
jgi:hypothetical protein